jgi:hypothetical protein
MKITKQILRKPEKQEKLGTDKHFDLERQSSRENVAERTFSRNAEAGLCESFLLIGDSAKIYNMGETTAPPFLGFDPASPCPPSAIPGLRRYRA